LQTAVDLGLPGLVAYLALLLIAWASCWRCARRGDPSIRPTALGLAAGLVGLHVYGLVDALAPGSKPGLAFWLALGLIAALARVAHQRKSERTVLSISSRS
jgi:putative inorganic carbon (HCO3(-)) transporter